MKMFNNITDSSSNEEKIQAICTLGAMYLAMSDNEKDYSDKKQKLLSNYNKFISTEEKIYFVEVGHNASHVFFIGMDREGNTYRRSYSCSWDIPDELDVAYYLLMKENKVDEAYALEEMVEEDKVVPHTIEELRKSYYGHW
jgi:hypothetical protein